MIGLLFSILMGLWPNPNPNAHPKPITGIGGFTTMSDSTTGEIGGETGHTPPIKP